MSDTTNYEHKIISQIYDAAIEPTLWPELLATLSEGLDEILGDVLQSSHIKVVPDFTTSHSKSIATDLPNQHNFLMLLSSHIDRAHAISEKLDAAVQSASSYRMIFDRLPIPALIINKQLGVISHNSLINAFLMEQKAFSIRNNVLQFHSNSLKKEVNLGIDALSSDSAKTTISVRLSDHTNTKPGSLLISRAQKNRDNHEADEYLILVASPVISSGISREFLMDLYALTRREADVVIQLVASKTLKEIAEYNHTSINTVRTHMKSIFTKTGTNRQSDLVKLILTSPFIAEQIARHNADKPHTHNLRTSCHQTCKLSDGRTLGYAEYGDSKGEPIFVFHPSTGSRLQSHPNDSIAESLGARLIIPDRPGFGLSSPLPGRKLSDWPKDVEQLANQLGINDFSIVGFCGGAPYALICAQNINERLKHVTIVSGVTPYDNINLLHGIKTSNRALIKVAMLLPNSVFNLISIVMRGMVNNPARYLDQLHGHLCKTDSDAFAEPEFLENFISSLGECLRQGPRAFSEDLLLFSQNWDFKPKEVKTPVTLWHGEQDNHISAQLANRLVNELANCQPFILPNYGHFMIYHRWRDILSHHFKQLSH